MKEIPKPLNPDYFDINILCWNIPVYPAYNHILSKYVYE